MEKGRSRAARGSVLLAATVAAVLLGACSGPTNTTDATPERYVESPKVSDQARQAYGDGAEAAYRELAEFSMDEWLKTDVLDPAGPEPTAEQLTDGIPSHLTNATAARWTQTVNAAVGGDDAAREDLNVLRLSTLDAPTLRLPPGNRLVISQTITKGSVNVGTSSSGITPLVIDFVQDAGLELRNARTPFHISLEKTVQYTVVPRESDPNLPTTAPATPATPGATGATGASASPFTRDPRVTWLISTFQGDVTADYEGAPEPTATE